MTEPSDEVADALARYRPEVQEALLALRAQIYGIAAAQALGPVVERLTWGYPTYGVGSGTSIRLGCEKKTDGDYGMFFKCQTSMVPTLRVRFGDALRFEGNRAVVFRLDEPFPEEAVREVVELALTYQTWKGRGA